LYNAEYFKSNHDEREKLRTTWHAAVDLSNKPSVTKATIDGLIRESRDPNQLITPSFRRSRCQ
jgi:hypothetical protein